MWGRGVAQAIRHVVDNIGGYHDYLMFEFSSPIIVDQVYLNYVYNGDSDMAIWIGTKTNPYTTHNTLSDSFLTGLGYQENNDTTLTTSRWANVNSSNRSGNVIVIAASVTDSHAGGYLQAEQADLRMPGRDTDSDANASAYSNANSHRHAGANPDTGANVHGWNLRLRRQHLDNRHDG